MAVVAEAEAAAVAMLVGVVVVSEPRRQQSSGDYIGHGFMRHTVVINVVIQKLFVPDRRTN